MTSAFCLPLLASISCWIWNANFLHKSVVKASKAWHRESTQIRCRLLIHEASRFTHTENNPSVSDLAHKDAIHKSRCLYVRRNACV